MIPPPLNCFELVHSFQQRTIFAYQWNYNFNWKMIFERHLFTAFPLTCFHWLSIRLMFASESVYKMKRIRTSLNKTFHMIASTKFAVDRKKWNFFYFNCMSFYPLQSTRSEHLGIFEWYFDYQLVSACLSPGLALSSSDNCR